MSQGPRDERGHYHFGTVLLPVVRLGEDRTLQHLLDRTGMRNRPTSYNGNSFKELSNVVPKVLQEKWNEDKTYLPSPGESHTRVAGRTGGSRLRIVRTEVPATEGGTR